MAVGRVLPQRRSVTESHETTRHAITPDVRLYLRKSGKQVFEYCGGRSFELEKNKTRRPSLKSSRRTIFVTHRQCRDVSTTTEIELRDGGRIQKTPELGILPPSLNSKRRVELAGSRSFLGLAPG